MKEMVRKFDIISEKPQLFNNGKVRFSSIFGGLITILLYLLAVGTFFYFFSKVVNRKEFNVSTSKFFNSKSEKIINTNNTIMGFQVLDRVGGLYDQEESLFQLQASYWQYYYEFNPVLNRTEWKFNTTILSMKKCGIIDFSNLELYTNYNYGLLDSFYCLDKNQIIKIYNQGFTNIAFSYINFYVTKCFNKTCKNDTEIDNSLSAFYIRAIFADYYVDHLNYKQPIVPYIATYSDTSSSSSYYKRKYHFLKQIEYDSDNGFFLPNVETQIASLYDNNKEQIDFRNATINGGKVLYQFSYSFTPQGFHEINTRNYVKIQTVIAEIGGFISALRIVTLILVMIFNEIYVYHDLFMSYIIFDNFEVSKNQNKNESNNNLNSVQVISVLNILSKLEISRMSVRNTRGKTNLKNHEFNLPNLQTLISKKICKRKHRNIQIFDLYKKSIQENYISIQNLIDIKNNLDNLTMYVIDDQKELKDFLSLNKILKYEKQQPYNKDYYIEKIQSKYNENLLIKILKPCNTKE